MILGADFGDRGRLSTAGTVPSVYQMLLGGVKYQRPPGHLQPEHSSGPGAGWPAESVDAGRRHSGRSSRGAGGPSGRHAPKTPGHSQGRSANSLIASAKGADHRKALTEAVAANRQAVQLSTQLYTQGQIDFLNVLNAQRSLFVSEDALVQSTGSVSTNLVALYKALGGGWND